MSEEQKVAIEFREFGSPPCKNVMGESWIGKAPRASASECLLLLLCLYMFAAAIFLWYRLWYEWVGGGGFPRSLM